MKRTECSTQSLDFGAVIPSEAGEISANTSVLAG
jgi:hypothetical protein